MRQYANVKIDQYAFNCTEKFLIHPSRETKQRLIISSTDMYYFQAIPQKLSSGPSIAIEIGLK